MIPVGITPPSFEVYMLTTVLRSLVHDDQGQDLLEYAAMAGLISILSVVLSNAARAL